MRWGIFLYDTIGIVRASDDVSPNTPTADEMRPDWNAGAHMLAVTIVSLNLTETYSHYISRYFDMQIFNRHIHICI